MLKSSVTRWLSRTAVGTLAAATAAALAGPLLSTAQASEPGPRHASAVLGDNLNTLQPLCVEPDGDLHSLSRSPLDPLPTDCTTLKDTAGNPLQAGRRSVDHSLNWGLFDSNGFEVLDGEKKPLRVWSFDGYTAIEHSDLKSVINGKGDYLDYGTPIDLEQLRSSTSASSMAALDAKRARYHAKVAALSAAQKAFLGPDPAGPVTTTGEQVSVDGGPGGYVMYVSVAGNPVLGPDGKQITWSARDPEFLRYADGTVIKGADGEPLDPSKPFDLDLIRAGKSLPVVDETPAPQPVAAPAVPEPAQPEPAQPEPAQPEPAQPEPAQPERAPASAPAADSKPVVVESPPVSVTAPEPVKPAEPTERDVVKPQLPAPAAVVQPEKATSPEPVTTANAEDESAEEDGGLADIFANFMKRRS